MRTNIYGYALAAQIKNRNMHKRKHTGPHHLLVGHGGGMGIATQFDVEDSVYHMDIRMLQYVVHE